MTIEPKVTTFADAFDRLSSGLTSSQSIQVGSFKDFLLNVWSLSFEHPEYFNAWHVGQIAEDIEYCLEEGLNYCAILPRFHFKSTVLGHAFSVWSLLKAKRDSAVLYLSYSDGMARYHISEINKAIRHGGLFSFKRGMHVNGALIADDVLRDPENPLNMSQITKVEDHFLTESMFIPLKGVPIIVLGTPMMPGDLLTKLQEDDRFFSRVLPALDPTPERRVLMPELYNEEWLLQQQKARPKSFASEFLLQPHFNTESYFDEADISKCEDESLRNLNAYRKYNKPENARLYAGFDVGKKRHPSHLVIFKKEGEYITQLHQSWLDGWNYTAQIEYLNEVMDNYDIEKDYIDNTRGELEVRGLDSGWWPMSFTLKSKNTMAQIMEEYVHSGRLKLFRDSRQTSQILSVNNELKAPETPQGHGDAFFSIAMALLACHESERMGFSDVGNLLEIVEPDLVSRTGEEAVADLEGRGEDPQEMWFPGNIKFDFGRLTNPDLTMADRPNPNCKEFACKPEFWVPERKLCIFCGHRG